MKNKSIFVMSLTFLLFIIFWIVGETIIFGDAILETSRIKSFFLNNKNIQRIERMVSQKDFSACYDVYFTSNNGKKYVFLNVCIENEKIVFYKLFQIDSQYKRGTEIETDSYDVSEQLDKLIR